MALRLRLPIRLRAALGATVVVLIALVISGFVLLLFFESNLRDSLDSTLSAQAEDRAVLIAAGSASQHLVSTKQQESFVWIGTSQGEVDAQSGLQLVNPPLGLTPGEPETISIRVAEEEDEDERETEMVEVRVVMQPVDAAGGSDLLVVVGAELEDLNSEVAAARRLILIGLPIVGLFVAVASWVAVGAAFRPIEQVRAEAEEISGHRLDRRLSLSGTGDEVDRLVGTMNEMLERLDQHEQSQRRFASDASHELKSPVANVRAMIEVAEVNSDDRDALLAELDRIAKIVEDLLFVTVQSESVDGHAQQLVHLDDVLFDEAELLRPDDSISISVGDIQPVDVMGSANHLRRAVRNVAENAVRHAETIVKLELRPEGDFAVARIIDDGVGIPAGSREDVFERFVRLDAGRARTAGGTGLGLAIAKQIVDSHGGDIRVTETPGGGATFTLRLPRAGDTLA
jgi:signal transduction histidine kinase